MDRFAGITAFVRVTESGGFTAAARRLNLSTTTVSEHVQALEDALGVRLLNRTSRRVSLTEIGREYYERCSQILHELEEADELASALRFDLAVMQVAPPDSTLVKRRLSGWRYVLCCAPRYLERHPAPRSPADLSEH